MTKILSDLITVVRNRGDMRSSSRFTDSIITTELQAAFAEGYQIIAQQNQGFFDLTGNVTTAASVAFVALPSGTWITRAIDRVEGNDRVPLPRIGIKDRHRYGVTTGKPCAHRLSARGIELYPPPDAAYTLEVLYTPVAPTLSSTPTEFYNSWEEYAISGALVRLYDQQGRDSSLWQTALAAARVLITRGSEERDSTGPEYLNLHEGYGDTDLADIAGWRPGY